MTQFDASRPAETIAVIVWNKEICFVFIDSIVHPHPPSSAFIMMYFTNRKLSYVLTTLEPDYLEAWGGQKCMNKEEKSMMHLVKITQIKHQKRQFFTALCPKR